MPTTSPFRSNSGPPELPGLSGTSVCRNGTYDSSPSERAFALTMPAVTVLSKPYGDPIATTQLPTFTFDESPSVTVGRSVAAILITATSERLSVPTTLALNSRPSVSLTVTVLALSTTCWLVRISPSGLTMNPEPTPITGVFGTGVWKWRKNCHSGSSGDIPRGGCGVCSLSVGISVTRTLTTAGPYLSTSALKSGSAATGVRALSAGATAGGVAAAAPPALR